MEPLVSVIIPVHNSAPYLEQCLNSILTQTYTNLEIICIDDASSDDSPSILKRFAKQETRIRLLYSHHIGGGGARNKGIDVAQGTYLLFLDSDDFFELDMVEKAVARSEKTQADITIYQSFAFDEQSKESFVMDWTYRAELIPHKETFCAHDMPDAIFNAFSNVAWNKLFRRDFILAHNLRFQEIARTNDLLFTCKALILAERIATLPKPLVHYRIGTLTSCQATNDHAPTEFYKAFSALHAYLVGTGNYVEYRNSFLVHALDGIVANAWSQRTYHGMEQILDVAVNYEKDFYILDYVDSLPYASDQVEVYRILQNPDKAEAMFSLMRFTKQQRDEAWAALRKTESALHDDRNRIIDLTQEIDNLEQRRKTELAARAVQINELENALAASKAEVESQKTELARIRNSKSFRLGTALTAPARKIKSLFDK